MIIPAVTYKILGFKKKIGDKDFTLEPTEGHNVALIQMDDGTLNEVSYFGNNSEMNSLYDYLEYKTSQSLKQDKISGYIADLSMTEDPILLKMIEDKEKEMEGSSKKEIYTALATEILRNKVSLKSGSIIRSALAFTTEDNGYASKFNSRSIISVMDKGELKYSTTGLYSQATLANQIPIEISPIKKSDGSFVGYFKLTTGTIISRQHVSAILDHSIRTIQNSIDNSDNDNLQGAFFPKIVGYVENNSSLNLIKNKINANKQRLDTLRKENSSIGVDEYTNFINDLKEYKELLFKDKVNLPKFRLELPILIPEDDFKSKTVLFVFVPNQKRPEDLSPFRVFADAVITLNFSKEDPHIKTQAKDYIVNTFLAQIANGNYAPRMLLNYNFPKVDILDNSDSWGYMKNNVDFSKLVLSFVDSKYIITEVEKYIDSLKG